MFKLTYLLPISLFLLLIVFYIALPPLRSCLLGDNSPRRMSARDWLIVAGISLAYAAVAFTGLGNTHSPETFHRFEGESVVMEIEEDVYPSRIMLFTGIDTGTYTIEFSLDGGYYYNALSFEQNYAEVLKWEELTPSLTFMPKYVRISASNGSPYLGELVLLDGDGQPIPLSCDIGELCDEQTLAPSDINFLNSSYFDEIYHARTAWEHLNTVYPYEVTHPPLGKLIISLGILLFGMTPFGWRFMGTFFGVLMLPIMYVLAKKLFGGKSVPACCTIVFAFDFMHFAQTRISTIDTYSVFFILLMYLFMYLFITSDRRLFLALSGVFFGFGAASKWTCFYAGAGLAVIWALYWIFNRKKGVKAFLNNCLFCVAFFVLVPALIYYLSYFPYGQAIGLSGVGMYFKPEYLKAVWDNQVFMFTYHSGLVAEHPYSSVWYQWLLDIRPILYYLKYYGDGTRSSFGAYVSPLLCWGGLLAIFVLLYSAIFRRDKKALFILIGYFAQLVPWLFVTRLTFAYHYFPSTVFLVLALGYVFDIMRLGTKRWRIYVYSFAAASLALFALFYPTISGAVVDNAEASSLFAWLPTWPF